MFNTLLESKATKQRSTGGTVFSVIGHVVVISLAVYATAHAGIKNTKEKVEKLNFVQVKPKAPEPPKPKAQEQLVAPPPPKGFQTLTAPVNIPDVIPNVDLTRKVTDEADFSGKGVEGGAANGKDKGAATDQPYFDFQVEKQAASYPSNPKPQYPDMLQTAGIAGEVIAQFVIDTTGHVEMASFKVIKSDNDLFTQSVKSVLPRSRFYPAEVGGRKVKELVELPYAFAVK
jgi:periplasmic protein TonB